MATRERRLICHVIHKLDYGGLENGLVNLINWMPAERYRHAIVCLTHATDFKQRIKKPDVAVSEIHKSTGKDLKAYQRVYARLRELAPDIVHTRNLPALDATFVARFAGVPRVVHSEHGLDMLEVSGRHRKYNALRWLSRVAVTRYLCVNRDLQDWMVRTIGLPSARVSVIYNGVDMTRFGPGDGGARERPRLHFGPGTFVIGGVGRFEPVKNFLGLARAFVRLLELRPALRERARLAIIGDGQQRADIEATLDGAGARELAWLPGFRDDVPDIYRQIDVFALPSLREGISNTALEAMASALPVVATRVGGNPEVIAEGATGKLVPPSDTDALARALIEYAESPADVARHGAAARKRVEERFSPAAMVAGYTDLYDSLLRN
jgi:sugar transferase (PEP-CTERM/EpsH1 system associated)